MLFSVSRRISCTTMWVSLFPRFSVFSPYSRSYSLCLCVSFYTFFLFLAIIQVLEYTFLICYVFQCLSAYSRSYSICVSFSSFCRFLAKIQVLKCVFSSLMFFTVSLHIPCPIVCVSHFARFSVFLAIFYVLQCAFLIFLVGEFYCHFPGPTVGISIFHVFQCFSPYSRSYSVCVSFSMIFSFFAKKQVL